MRLKTTIRPENLWYNRVDSLREILGYHLFPYLETRFKASNTPIERFLLLCPSILSSLLNKRYMRLLGPLKGNIIVMKGGEL